MIKSINCLCRVLETCVAHHSISHLSFRLGKCKIITPVRTPRGVRHDVYCCKIRYDRLPARQHPSSPFRETLRWAKKMTLYIVGVQIDERIALVQNDKQHRIFILCLWGKNRIFFNKQEPERIKIWYTLPKYFKQSRKLSSSPSHNFLADCSRIGTSFFFFSRIFAVGTYISAIPGKIFAEPCGLEEFRDSRDNPVLSDYKSTCIYVRPSLSQSTSSHTGRLTRENTKPA